jgi:hypothetical protein
MELDDFKKDATPGSANGTNGNGSKLNSFIEELKAQDAVIRKKRGFMVAIYSMLFVVYAGTFSLQKDGMKLGYSLLVLGFCLILGYFFYRFLQLNKIDYTAPVNVFLRKAEKRYAYMTLTDWIIIIPILLILGAGGLLVVWFSFGKYVTDPYWAAGIYLVVFFAAVGIGFWASPKQWEKDNGDLYRKIRAMKGEFSD